VESLAARKRADACHHAARPAPGGFFIAMNGQPHRALAIFTGADLLFRDGAEEA